MFSGAAFSVRPYSVGDDEYPNLTPGVAALLLRGQLVNSLGPTVLLVRAQPVTAAFEANVRARPANDNLRLTAQPLTLNVVTDIDISPAAGNLRVSGQSANLELTAEAKVFPGAGTVVVAGQAPAVSPAAIVVRSRSPGPFALTVRGQPVSEVQLLLNDWGSISPLGTVWTPFDPVE